MVLQLFRLGLATPGLVMNTMGETPNVYITTAEKIFGRRKSFDEGILLYLFALFLEA